MQRPAAVISALIPYRMSATRGAEREPRHPTAARRPRHVRRAATLASLISLGAVGLLSIVPVSADTSGTTTGTINIAVRSINVSPSTTSFNACADNLSHATGSVLSFPNGNCGTIPGVTITNGTAPGHIDVQGANAIPSDSGTPWTLCGGGGSSCTGGTSTTPGTNQFLEQATGGGPILTTSAQCDTGFSSGCAATSSQATTEILALFGPSASTDTSTAFTTVWTWTAVP